MRFSVVVAVYNVSRFFGRGMAALMAQDYGDFEVILVDDGATDGSAGLCDAAAREHANVRVIHSRNEGLGPARNKGMAVARGEYVMFYDLDDLLLPNALSTIAARLDEAPVDVLVFSYCEIDAATGRRTVLRFAPQTLRSNEEIRGAYVPELCGMRFNNGFMWNKVYRRGFLEEHGLQAEPLRIQQDEVFNLGVYPRAQTMRVVDDVLLDYFIYSKGNNRSRHIPDRLEIYRTVHRKFLATCRDWGVGDEAFRLYVERRFADSVMEYVRCNVLEGHVAGRGEQTRMMQETMSADDVQAAVAYILAHGPGEKRPFYEAMRDCDVRRYVRLYGRARRMAALKRRIRLLLKGKFRQ